MNQSYDLNASKSNKKSGIANHLSQTGSSSYLNPTSNGIKLSKVNIKNSRQNIDMYNDNSAGQFNSVNYTDQTNTGKNANKKLK